MPVDTRTNNFADRRPSLARLDMRWAWPALFCLITLILFYRQPGAIRHPSFIAEDGNIFFKQQFEHGFSAALLTTYNGYLHFAPRIVAGLASKLPLEQIPAAYAIVSLLGAAGALTFFFAPGFRPVINHDLLRGVIVLILTMMPNADSLMRLAYICWYLLFFLALLTLFVLPKSVIWRAFLFLIAALSICSAPLSIICFPLILLRSLLARERGEKILWMALAFVIVLFLFPADHATVRLSEAFGQPHWFIALVHAIGYRVFCYFFLGERTAHPLPAIGWLAVTRFSLLLAGISTIGAIAATSARRISATDRRAPYLLLYLIFALPALFIVRTEWTNDFLVWNDDHTWLWHQRYFLCSTLLLCVLCGVIFERLFFRRFRTNARTGVVGVIFLFGWLTLHSLQYRLWDWRSPVSWQHYSQLIRAAEARAIETGNVETVTIQTAVPEFNFDLVIDPKATTRNLRQ